MRTRVALSVRTILLYVWTEEKKWEKNNISKYIIFRVLEYVVYTHMVLQVEKYFIFIGQLYLLIVMTFETEKLFRNVLYNFSD